MDIMSLTPKQLDNLMNKINKRAKTLEQRLGKSSMYYQQYISKINAFRDIDGSLKGKSKLAKDLAIHDVNSVVRTGDDNIPLLSRSYGRWKYAVNQYGDKVNQMLEELLNTRTYLELEQTLPDEYRRKTGLNPPSSTREISDKLTDLSTMIDEAWDYIYQIAPYVEEAQKLIDEAKLEASKGNYDQELYNAYAISSAEFYKEHPEEVNENYRAKFGGGVSETTKGTPPDDVHKWRKKRAWLIKKAKKKIDTLKLLNTSTAHEQRILDTVLGLKYGDATMAQLDKWLGEV